MEEFNSVDFVKKTCKEQGIPISKLESDCGFSNGYIRKLKKGHFTTDKAAVIAKYLNMSVDLLANGEESEFTTENAMLDAKISKDTELKSAIRKYYTLSDKQRKHVLDTINMLAEDNGHE